MTQQEIDGSFSVVLFFNQYSPGTEQRRGIKGIGNVLLFAKLENELTVDYKT